MLEILFCDNHLLVVNKPAGLLSQPDASDSPSIEELAKAYLKERFQKPGNVFLEAVHRLDRPVSGILVFARTSKALSRLNQAQREGVFQKEYLALVEGLLADEGELVDHLRHDAHLAVADPAGKECRLTYSVIEKRGDCTLLRVKLKTGRYHQIRAQFALRGHPVVGDRKYGSSTLSDLLFLHHNRLSFPHPISGEVQTIELEPHWGGLRKWKNPTLRHS